MRRDRTSEYAWALYDWANSAFATTVMAAFFPVMFKEYWCAGAAVTESSWRLGVTNALASAVVMVLAPVLGAIGDRSGTRRRLLFAFALLGIAATGSLTLVGRGDWVLAALLFVVGAIGFSCSCVFYDALLVQVAAPDRIDRVSSLGYSLGYLGGGLLFVLNVCMVQWPAAFGLADQGQALHLAFLSVAVWWLVFSLPLLRWVPEPAVTGSIQGVAALRAGLVQLGQTLREIRRTRAAFLFLVGYWFYIDGVDTIIRMAMDYGLSIGLDRNDLLAALAITQFVGFPAALLFGVLGERLGARTGIFIGIAVYVGITIWGYSMQTAAEFYVLAVAVGLVQGGVQSLSRSLFARLVPAGRTAEFFGFYNMLGKFAAVLGPLLMSGVGLLTGNPRTSILAVILLFAVGGLLLYRVEEPPRIAAAD
ncbi:MAG: MFS transporter [Candidatus Latescibacterota bacterium]